MGSAVVGARRGCNGRRCTVHTVHRTVEFTGPVPCMVLSARCCATTGAVATLLVHAWLDSGYMFCVFTWVRYGRIQPFYQ